MELIAWSKIPLHAHFPFGPEFTSLMRNCAKKLAAATIEDGSLSIHIGDDPQLFRLGWVIYWKDHGRDKAIYLNMKLEKWRADGMKVGLNSFEMGLESVEGRWKICQQVTKFLLSEIALLR